MSQDQIQEKLIMAGVRPTKMRAALAGLLFDGQDKHVSVDEVIAMARKAGLRPSVATIYNTLNQFCAAGLLRRISVDAGRTFFDTNMDEHHHIFYESEGRLVDVPADQMTVAGAPPIENNRSVKAVEVLIRVAD